ncbi:unnamed protein product [Caenorhabditis sp. 36 PRJEB53466]|nr:unnamed protein product [Caenorhabditis sp. 36 PRJEB53466]
MPCESKCHGGPGYVSPRDAINGPRENILFTTAPHAADGHDAIFSIDVNPNSGTYCQVVSRVDVPNIGDEVHHTGWNSCSSCHDKPTAKRSHLILPCLNSDRIYVINVKDERNIFLQTTVEPSTLHGMDLSFPHTSHCLADGNIMISTLGRADGTPSGNFLLLDGNTFKPKGTWPVDGKTVQFNYDFWYQPRRNIMISTEWGSPNNIKKGFDLWHVEKGLYGNSVHIFEWDSKKYKQRLTLPMPHGALPLEVRYLHEPTSENAFIGCALGSSIFRIHTDSENNCQTASLVSAIPPKKVTGWVLPEMPALITDILISMDDLYLYVSCWLHGDIRQYDISDPANPKLCSQVYIGGSIHSESPVTVVDQITDVIPALYVKGRKVEGGPQMLQLSLDGKRLYVTTSLYKKWDEQFYPSQLKTGAVMLLIDVDPVNGKMIVNSDFLVDFGTLPGGPYLAHEMRYPGGDCTSDIWI